MRSLEAHEAPPELQGTREEGVDPPGGTGLLREPAQSSADVGNLVYDTVLEWPAFDAWLARLEAAELVALDTETTSLDEMRAEIVGISFSVKPGEAAYVPAGAQLPRRARRSCRARRCWPGSSPGWRIRRRKSSASTSSTTAMCSPTTASRWPATCTTPCCRATCWRCTSRTAWPAWPSGTWGAAASTTRTCAARARTRSRSARSSIEKAAEYSCEDSDQTLDVHLALWPRIQADEKLRFIYQLEIDSSEALYRIERNGVLIDAPQLAAQSHELGKRIMALEQEAYAIAGQPFNLGSPKQIGDIFFNKLGLPVVKKTPSGVPSTDEEVLEKLAENYPLPAKILEHRGLSKLKGTYTDKLAPDGACRAPAACTPTTRRRWP